MTLFPLSLIVFAVTQGQDASLKSVLQGTTIPLTMVSKDMPADYKPCQIQMSTNSGMEGFLMSPFAMIGMIDSQSKTKSEEYKILQLSSASWTRGDTVTLEGIKYYITYYVPLTDVVGAETEWEAMKKLSLRLLRVDAVQSITPMGDFKFPSQEDMPKPLDESAVASESLSRVRDLGKAAIMLFSDSNDVIPYVQSSASMMGELIPYCKNLESMKSPQGSRYIFNTNLAGVMLSSIPSPSNTVQFYELNALPDGRRVVGFVDGHARILSNDEWLALEIQMHKTKFLKTAGVKPLPANHLLDRVPISMGGKAPG